jgi:serine/threonine protein kinase
MELQPQILVNAIHDGLDSVSEHDAAEFVDAASTGLASIEAKHEIKESSDAVLPQLMPHVSKKDFETISVIGKGSYGTVTLVRKKDSRRLYAMKALKKRDIIRKAVVD